MYHLWKKCIVTPLAPIHMTFYYACTKSVLAEKNVCCRMRILTDSAGKRNRKEVLVNYNKSIINIGMTVGWNWRKCWEFKLMLKCYCTCSLEIGTCIINDAGKQGAHMFSRYILTFNAKTKLKFFFNKLTGTITLNIFEDMQM